MSIQHQAGPIITTKQVEKRAGLGQRRKFLKIGLRPLHSLHRLNAQPESPVPPLLKISSQRLMQSRLKRHHQ